MPIYVFTEDHKASTISTVIEKIEKYNENFRSSDETFTFRYMIQRPAEGTSVIPYAFGVGSTELPIDSLGAQNPCI